MTYRHSKDWKAMALIGALCIPVYVLASCSQAQAQTVDGNYLHKWCSDAPALVSGYVTGVVDALLTVKEDRFCLPPNGNVKQNGDVVCKGLLLNPEYRNLDASMLTHAFLAEAFPCQ